MVSQVKGMCDTGLAPKVGSGQNPVKYALIVEFLSMLDGLIENGNSEQASRERAIPPVLEVDAPLDELREAGPDEIPCTRSRCKFVEYLQTFYDSEVWLLPVSDVSKLCCAVCARADVGALSMHRLRLTTGRRVIFI